MKRYLKSNLMQPTARHRHAQRWSAACLRLNSRSVQAGILPLNERFSQDAIRFSEDG
jgi:hypothetical protein